VIATRRGPDSAAAVSANVVVDDRQMNALFLDLVSNPIFIWIQVIVQLAIASKCKKKNEILIPELTGKDTGRCCNAPGGLSIYCLLETCGIFSSCSLWFKWFSI
jgi:hypothetical protein